MKHKCNIGPLQASIIGVLRVFLPSFFYSFRKINIRDFFHIYIIWYICSVKTF
nr:MAG TPA: hypothetical protein [Caudoviricetes sp.]